MSREIDLVCTGVKGINDGSGLQWFAHYERDQDSDFYSDNMSDVAIGSIHLRVRLPSNDAASVGDTIRATLDI